MSGSTELYGDEHVARYLETDGAEGYAWRNGTTILVLFTQGRKSGEERTNALIFQPWGDSAYLIVASKGGAEQPPAWFLNLEAHPEAIEIQVKGDRFPVHARIADDTEKPAMWHAMVETWPDYDSYQEKTDRVIPIVVLERTKN